MKRVAIAQSNYVPWKGYFDLINTVDEFILYDDRQYTRRDWRNRNRIKTPHGAVWLTIPVVSKGRYTQRIDATAVSDPRWAERHWRMIQSNYSAAPFFATYRERLEHLYLGPQDELLSLINRRFLSEICGMLAISTPLTSGLEAQDGGDATDRLVELCLRAGATHYLSGPAARNYIAAQKFADRGLALEFFDYSGYPEYAQLYPPFDHAVSVLDLILNVGADAWRYMKSFSP